MLSRARPWVFCRAPRASVPTESGRKYSISISKPFGRLTPPTTQLSVLLTSVGIRKRWRSGRWRIPLCHRLSGWHCLRHPNGAAEAQGGVMLTTIWMPVSSLLVDTPPVHRHRRLIHLHKDFPNSTYKPVVGRNHFVNYQLVKRDAGRASVRPCLTWHLVIGGPLCLLSGPTGSDRLHPVM